MARIFISSKAFILICLVIPISVLIGWITHFPALRNFNIGQVSMNPLTATLFIIILPGVYLTLQERKSRITIYSAGIVFGVSCIILCRYLLGLTINIETYFWGSQVYDALKVNLVSPTTGLIFFLQSGGILLRNANKLPPLCTIFFLLSLIVSFFALTGYIFGAPEFYSISNHTPIAFITALLFLLLSTALLIITETAQKLFIKGNIATKISQQVLPLIILVPMIIGLIGLYLSRQGMVSNEFGVTFVITTTIFFLSAVLIYTALEIHNQETEALQAKLILREKESILAAALQQTNDPFIVTDRKQVPYITNKAAESLFHFTANEKKKHLTDVLKLKTDIEKQMIKEKFSIIETNLKSQSFNIESPHGSGYRQFQGTIVALLNNKSLEGFVISMKDITQQIEHERSIIEKNLFVNSIIAHIPEMIYVKDAKDLRIIKMNRAAEKFFGKPETEVVGKKIEEILPENKAEVFYISDVNELKGGVKVTPATKIQLDNNTTIWLQTKKVAIYGFNGEISHILVVASDISERKEYEEKLNDLNSALDKKVREKTYDLDESNKELNTFIYRATHDLRGPITSIKGLLYLLASHPEEFNRDSKFFGMIKSSTNKLDTILVKLIETLNVKNQHLEISEHHIATLIKAVIEKVKSKLKSPAVISIQCDDIFFPTDESLLSGALEKILENSLMYSDGRKKETRIDIAVCRKEMLEITVADNGIGIMNDLQSRVFEMFFRGNNYNETTGLGLYYAKNAVNRLNGKISLESKPDVGTIVLLQLPAGIAAKKD